MARIHGRWGHYVKPGLTDPNRYGSSHFFGESLSEDDLNRIVDTRLDDVSALQESEIKGHQKRKNRAAGQTVILNVPLDDRGTEVAVELRPDIPFAVFDKDGKRLYHCSENKADGIRLFLLRMLPQDSFVQVSSGLLILVKSVQELGFADNRAFASWCAHKGRMKS